MNFKPGDKVWIENRGGRYPVGTYAGILVRPSSLGFIGWWEVDVENIPAENGFYPNAHESSLRRRDDPPEQQPQREATGDWELCPWRPAVVAKETA